MITLLDVKAEDVELMRIARMSSLPVFQELYMEFMATGKLGQVRRLKMYRDDESLGYLIVGTGNSLLEFFLQPNKKAEALDCFDHTLQTLQIQTIFCQSFDDTLLDLCNHHGFSHRVIGHLYREQVNTPDFPLDDLSARWAGAHDLPMLQSLEDEVFEPRHLLKQEVENNGVMLFMLDNQLAGCGFLTRIHPSFNTFDLGVWTHPFFRRKGVARRIVSHLKKVITENGTNVTCGCDAANSASQKTLARNGFISRYSLLEFKVGTLF